MNLTSSVDALVKSYTTATPLLTVQIDRQVACFLKKFPFKGRQIATRSAGIQKFRDAEAQCAWTNRKFRKLTRATEPSFLSRARRLIADVLGDTVTPDIMREIAVKATCGPGSTATNESKSGRTTPYYKYMDLPYSVTAEAKNLATYMIECNPRWVDLLENSGERHSVPFAADSTISPIIKAISMVNDSVIIVNEERIDFVLKDFRTDRPIGIGSSLNMMLQLGVKAYMQRRLLAFGVDLTDQTRNRELAYAGSCVLNPDLMADPSQQWSTIDLSSASDTVSYELVKALLPAEWFSLLDMIRHKSGRIKDKLYVYHKFSAMGNGTTFPLESLIFWAVAKAATQGLTSDKVDIAVYGDDIICRQYDAQPIVSALQECGFSINTEKSFLTGPFKESCGADFFLGSYVRPFYLKRELKGRRDVYFCINSLNSQRLAIPALSNAFSSCIDRLLEHIPEEERRYTPLSKQVVHKFEGSWTSLDTVSEDGYAVPLNFMRRVGRNPYMNMKQLRHFKATPVVEKDNKKVRLPPLLKEEFPADKFNRLPYVVRSTEVALTYSGKASVRLWLSLKKVPLVIEKWMNVSGLLHVAASNGGVVTRSKMTRYIDSVHSVPNWNANWTTSDLCSLYASA